MTDVRVKPLFEDASASAELRNFVALARADGPSQADLDRLASQLGPAVGLSAGVLLVGAAASAGALGTPPAELGLQPVAAKLGLFGKLFASGSAKLMAVGLSAGLGVALWFYAGPERPNAGRQANPSPSAPSEPAPPGSSQRSAPSQPAPEREPSAVAAAAPAAEVDPPGSAAAPSALPGDPDVPSVRASPRAGSSVAARSARSAGERTAGRARRRAAEPAVSGAVKPEPSEQAPAPAAERPSELSLIQQAQAARGRAADALSLLATHARLYPDGALAQEREVLAIELLLKSGRPDQARARAARFAGEHPRSAHLPRVRALLERAGTE